MEEMLKSYLACPEDSDLKLTFQANAGKGGQTELILYADNGYRFWSTQTKGNKKVEFAGYRDTPEVRSVFESLTHSGFWSNAENGKPAEAQVTLSSQGIQESVVLNGSSGQEALKAIDNLIRAISPDVMR